MCAIVTATPERMFELDDSENVCGVIGAVNNHFPASQSQQQSVSVGVNCGECVWSDWYLLPYWAGTG